MKTKTWNYIYNVILKIIALLLFLPTPLSLSHSNLDLNDNSPNILLPTFLSVSQNYDDKSWL